MNTLCGVQMIRNGDIYDYCYTESILSMIECCDHVIVVVVESEDATLQRIKNINSGKLTIIELPDSAWYEVGGKERLSHLTNIGIQEANRLGYEYVIQIQGDEVIHEKSYSEIRKAIEGGYDAYICSRINLWGDCYHKVDVPQERKPCSTSVIRLAKSKYRSYDDSENLGVPVVNTYYESGIVIFHYGFVRKKEVMKAKIINMQENVFGMGHDKKLDECEIFNPKLWFDGDDLAVIDYPHPKIMQKWIQERP